MHSVGSVQVVVIKSTDNMTKFKKMAGKKLGIKAKKVFLSTGAEILDVDEMQNNDMLYISQGEPFYKNAGRHMFGLAHSRSPTT